MSSYRRLIRCFPEVLFMLFLEQGKYAFVFCILRLLLICAEDSPLMST